MRKDRKRWTHPNWLSFCRICWFNQLGRGISTPQQMLRLQQWLTMKLQENSAVDNLVNETHFPCDTATPIGNSFFGSFCVPSSDFLQMLRVSLSKKKPHLGTDMGYQTGILQYVGRLRWYKARARKNRLDINSSDWVPWSILNWKRVGVSPLWNG